MTVQEAPEDLLNVVRALEPIIRQHADEAERNHRLSQPVVHALAKAALFRMWIPKTLSGLEVSPLTGYRVVEEVARLDGSTGWSVFVGASSAITTAFLADLAAEDMCGRDPMGVIGGSSRASGRPSSRKTGISSVVGGPMRAAASTVAGCWHCAK